MMASHPPSCTTHTIYNRSMVPVACQSACSSVSNDANDHAARYSVGLALVVGFAFALLMVSFTRKITIRVMRSRGSD